MPTGIAQQLSKRPGDALTIRQSFSAEVHDADGNRVDALSRTLADHTITVRRTPPTLLLDEDVTGLDSVTVALDQDHKLFVSNFERLVVKGVPSKINVINDAVEAVDVRNPDLRFRLKSGVGEVGETLYITVTAQRENRGPTEKVIQVNISE